MNCLSVKMKKPLLPLLGVVLLLPACNTLIISNGTDEAEGWFNNFRIVAVRPKQ
ncbi:MAG: hypothetical protein IKQ79_00745 [Bacteroidales bacterium]|nr:hypothetical protein [Bacteroidales bacterium]